MIWIVFGGLDFNWTDVLLKLVELSYPTRVKAEFARNTGRNAYLILTLSHSDVKCKIDGDYGRQSVVGADVISTATMT